MSPGADHGGASPRWFRLALAAITVAGAAGWVAYAVGADVPRLAFNDARNFHLLADGLASGEGYVRPVERVELGGSVATAEYPPLFPAVLSIGSRLGFDGFGDHQALAALLAATAIPLTGLLGRRLGGPVAGLASAALVALHPMLVQLGASMMSEALYLPLVVAILLATLRARDLGRAAPWAGVGVLAGLAALTRGEGVVVGGIVAAVALAADARIDRRRAWRHAGAVVLGLLVVVVPWSVERTMETGAPVLVSANQQTVLAGSNCEATYTGGFRGWWAFNCFADALQPGDTEGERYADLTSTAVEHALDHPAQLPGVATIRVLRAWGLYDLETQLEWETTEGRRAGMQRAGWAFTLALVPLAAGGAWWLRRRGRPWALLVAMPAMATFTAATTYGNQRFRIAAEPALVVLAVMGIAALVATRRRRAGPNEPIVPDVPPGGTSEPIGALVRPPGRVDREPRNRRLEGLRAVAALAVMGTHLGFATGTTFSTDLGAYVARLDIGVAIFFVLSGYLLHRPFVRSTLDGTPAPAAGAYLWRRFLRIVPAYWVALAGIPILLGIDKIRSFADLVIYGGFLQIYDRDRALSGITQAWSLCTEMSFYLALPLYALALRRLGRRLPDRRRIALQWAGLAALYAISVAFRSWLQLAEPGIAPIAWAWLPANADLFALGMGVALVEVSADRHVPAARLQDLVARHGRWCWLGAAVVFWAVSTRLGLPRGLEETTAAQELTRHLLYGVVGLLTVAPLALGAVRDHVGRVLGTAPMVWLGVISYGIYVWHLDVIGAGARWLDAPIGTTPAVLLVPIVVPVSILVAAASWYRVEHPLLRFRHVGGRRHAGEQVPTRDERAEEEVVPEPEHVPW